MPDIASLPARAENAMPLDPLAYAPGQPLAHDRAYLRQLLAQRNQSEGRHAAIDAAIEQAFVRDVAMLVLDMCGFSRITASHGIIHFLAMVHQMEQAARPAIAGNGGEVVKQEADNLFAVFGHPVQALEAALDIDRALCAMNAVQAPEAALHASMGIGYGPTLVIAGMDLFGHEMNLACKLGEDIAGPGEILLTASACAQLPAGRYVFSDLPYTIGGTPMPAHRLEGCLFERPLGGAQHG